MAGFFRRGFAIRAAVCGLLCSGLPAACGLPDYRFVDEATGGNSGVGRPRCETNQDCARYASTKTCDPTGHCVECFDTSGSPSTCAPGLYCNVNRCDVGCASNAACPTGLSCDVTAHRCRGCTQDRDCPTGTGCKAGECVSACTDESSCPAGFTCCNGSCASFGSSPLHCGSCEKVCADEQDCINAECGEGSGCKGWLADCDKSPGCEVNLRSDRKHCGECQIDCGDKNCSGGTCTGQSCSSNTADCDNEAATGCETLLTTTDDCGVCHNQCSSVHGTPACIDFTCTISCDPGFKDCDNNPKTGCETDLQNSDTNCGACGVTCANANGRTHCELGQCSPSCSVGFADCDGIPENGCETDLTSDEKNCGKCGTSCLLAHSTGSCEAGVCNTKCDPDYDDCNGGMDGCESNLKQAQSCGKCGVNCNSNGGTAACPNGVCTITCTGTNRDCVNGASDGCETNIATNVKNCGGCGIACEAPLPGNSVACVNSQCVYSDCTAPLADCDGNTSCETNLTSDAKNCGGCGLACTAFNGTAACVNEKCVVVGCDAGYADCTPADGCETKLGDKLNCTKCGEACLDNVRTKNSCAASGCAPTCAVGWGDCDGIPDNGCETQLNTPTNCGRCQGTCKLANAETSCDTGVCTITRCADGFGDCNNESPPNGCETPLTTKDNCGACGKPCEALNASESCATGTCQQGACDAGFADCSDKLAGCETPLGTATNCGTCNDACAPNNVTQNLCTGTPPNARCSPTCQPGYKSCDGIGSNGCETSLNTPDNCGDCKAVCALPNAATHTCTSGTCQVATCNPGFAHCDSSQTNGCEQVTSNDVNHCGDCTTQCSSVNGTAKCTNGVCSTTCAAGFGDCNMKPLDGCEQDVTSDPNFCGNCSTKCSGSTPFCVSSACKAHLTIGIGSPVSGSVGNAGPLTIVHALKNGPEARRLLVIGVAARGNGTFARPTSVRYGSVSMVPTLQREAQTVNQAWSGIYTLPNSVLPAAGTTSNVVITGSNGNTAGLIANVIELTNVDQTNSIDGQGGSAHGQCNGSVTDTISTLTDGALVYSVVGFYGNPLSGASATSGQTVSMPFVTTNDTGGVAGTFSPGGPINNLQFTWGASSCFTAGQSLLAFRPATTLAF